MARTPALFIDGKFKSPAADQRVKTPFLQRLSSRPPSSRSGALLAILCDFVRFCAILSAKISLLPPRIARNGLISETGSLLTAPSSGESDANWTFGEHH